ncbi:hypothetical protein ACN2CC_17805 [Mesorhizobium muleiense]|uniref:hypothetical protein n=1 Tax=Mesorhizobium muleiense TaxID=1004279 RepID=UPI003AFAC9F2
MMQHLTKVPLVERLATNGAELECSASSLAGGPWRLPLIPVAGLLVLSRLTLVSTVHALIGDGPTATWGATIGPQGPSQRGAFRLAGWGEFICRFMVKKPIAYFKEGGGKGLVLNKTNAMTVATITGKTGRLDWRPYHPLSDDGFVRW